MKKKAIVLLVVSTFILSACGSKKTNDEKLIDVIKTEKLVYVNVIKEYISAVKMKVVAGEYNFIKEKNFYLINVNADSDDSCISLEKGGFSPFGDFLYAYVGIDYDGIDYNYYWISKDTRGYGTNTMLKDGDINEEAIIDNVIIMEPRKNDVFISNKPSIIISKATSTKC